MESKYIISVLLVLSLFLVGCQQQKESNTINVDGSSEITAKPDQAEVWLGISILKSNAADAQSESNKITNAIIDGLRYKGIQDSDIQTESLSLYEETQWDNGKSKSVGWRATQTIKVKTKDLTKVGTIVDIGVNNGANQVNNINFGLSAAKEQEFKQQALADASKNAKSKAETIAQSLGVKLGRIKSVTESNFDYSPYPYMMKSVVGADAVREAAAVLPKDVSVTAQISLVYEII